MAKIKKNKRTEAVNQWTDNTMTKRKKNKRTEAVIQWTDNTMAKHGIVCPLIYGFCPLFFFLFVIVLSVH
jgi:hypothetical protein